METDPSCGHPMHHTIYRWNDFDRHNCMVCHSEGVQAHVVAQIPCADYEAMNISSDPLPASTNIVFAICHECALGFTNLVFHVEGDFQEMAQRAALQRRLHDRRN